MNPFVMAVLENRPGPSLIGFTGTRFGMRKKQADSVYQILGYMYDRGAFEFHHGDCIGADCESHEICVELGYSIRIHPPLNQQFQAHCSSGDCRWEEPADYTKRNQRIVERTDMTLGIPSGYQYHHRSGTWSTIHYAVRKSKPVMVVTPDGIIHSTEEEVKRLISPS